MPNPRKKHEATFFVPTAIGGGTRKPRKKTVLSHSEPLPRLPDRPPDEDVPVLMYTSHDPIGGLPDEFALALGPHGMRFTVSVAEPAKDISKAVPWEMVQNCSCTPSDDPNYMDMIFININGLSGK
jgi:hypothetical protein